MLFSLVPVGIEVNFAEDPVSVPLMSIFPDPDIFPSTCNVACGEVVPIPNLPFVSSKCTTEDVTEYSSDPTQILLVGRLGISLDLPEP